MVWLVGNKGMLGTDVEEVLKEKKIDHIFSDKEVDITNILKIKEYIKDKKISCIVNCSAYTAVDKAEDEYEQAFKINRDGVKNLAVISKENNALLIHISTDYVYDGCKEGEYFEKDITNPLSVYGKSKLAGEEELKKIVSDYYIIRTSWLYGKNGNNFVYTMLRLFKEKDFIKVVKDQVGSPTYSRDLANFIAYIITGNIKKYGTFHFSNEGYISWYYFALQIYKYGKEYNKVNKEVEIIPIETNEYPTKAIRPKNSAMSKDKLKNIFNYQIPNWEKSLEIFIKSI